VRRNIPPFGAADALKKKKLCAEHGTVAGCVASASMHRNIPPFGAVDAFEKEKTLRRTRNRCGLRSFGLSFDGSMSSFHPDDGMSKTNRFPQHSAVRSCRCI